MSEVSQMSHPRPTRRSLRRMAFVAVLVFVSGAVRQVHAQAIAESAATTASAGVAASGAKRVQLQPLVLATPKPESSSPHLTAHDGPPAEELNRKAIEEQAGKDAAKLLMRSSPSGAQIFINGAFVGHTPLLLVVAPGKYRVEMRGDRDDSAESTVGLLANDTQQVTLKLKDRYPTSVTTR